MMISAVFIPIVFSVLFIGLIIKGLYRCDQEIYVAFGVFALIAVCAVPSIKE